MTEDVDAAFGRFAVAERPGLLAAALALTGDAARAEEAVQVALARTRARWGRPDPRGTAHDALEDAVTGWRGRLAGRQQVLESLDAPAVAPAAPPAWRLGPADAVTDALGRARRSRRRRGAGLGAALAAVAVAVPLAWPAPTPPATPQVPAPVVAAPPAVPVLTAPTRGSLAGDAAFLDAVRRVDWGPVVPPPAGQRDVVLATDTLGGRVVLLAGTVDEDVRGVWLTGPVGAPADQLTPFVPRRLGPFRPASLLLDGPGQATLVVVAGPDDAVEVSPRLQVGPRGTVARTYERVHADRGVAVVPVPTTAAGAGTSVRVLRDGQVVYRSAPEARSARGPIAAPDLEPLRPVAVRPAPRAVAAALAEVAVPLGVEPDALEPRLLWSGEVPLEGVPGTVAVVVARSPGGGLVVTTWAAQVGPGGAGRAVPCGVHTPPGTADVAGLVVARVCDFSAPETEPSDAGRWLVVTAPASAAQAAVLDRRGGVLATVPLAAGGVVAPLAEDARTVRTLDADGRAIAEVPVAAPAVSRFGDYGDGPVR
ncbi:hypothetical protein GCU56_00785 [Geodermatophilus sabuli]|uniref:DNA-directed RNA polymerase specialized sigma24 family protein n=1 Tax=Geodermatophilus sabuli TaxID=1564158 RepID=A0A7K3VUT0_9ACTN|nr:hypothetical protein [Geodermatophilus sabuli]NEK56409.1 hypothetical protein [Geodermatophilus sabuli]